MNERINWIDNAKAIGIFLVVVGHSSLNDSVEKVVYAFHMPLFFFLAGITFSNKICLKEFLYKRFRSIIVPYIFFAFATYGLSLIIRKFQNSDPENTINSITQFYYILYGSVVDQRIRFNAPLWFLPCFFISQVVYYFVSLLTDYKIYIVVFLAAVAASYVVNFPIPWGGNTALTGLVFTFFGHSTKKIFNNAHITSTKTAIFICSFFVLLSTSHFNELVNLSINYIGNPFLFYTASVSGIIVLIYLAQFIKRNYFLSLIGANSLIILSIHNITNQIVKKIFLMVFDFDLSETQHDVIAPLLFGSISIIFCLPVIVFFNKYASFLLGRKY
jgi:fucose 4-O-acetylase-like acetyltransferase